MLKRKTIILLILLLLPILTGCGESVADGGAATGGDPCLAAADPNLPAARAVALNRYTPAGRVFVADQAGDTVSVIDVAANQKYNAIPTGRGPHHVAVSPDNRELWVTHYNEKYLAVYCISNGTPLARVEAEGQTDDLAFTPDGKYLFVSMGQDNVLAVVDVAARSVVAKVPVGKVPHGVRVRPDGRVVYVTNTLDNTVTAVDVASRALVATIPSGGANPFELIFSPNGGILYVSNFLGGSISLIDTATNQRLKIWRTGSQPAMMLTISDTLYVASTGEGKLWVQNAADPRGAATNKITTGKETHGVVVSNAGTLYVTNIKDNSVTVIDANGQPLTTIAVGSQPNGLVYTPYAGLPQ